LKAAALASYAQKVITCKKLLPETDGADITQSERLVLPALAKKRGRNCTRL
jgi:hypothetical protein